MTVALTMAMLSDCRTCDIALFNFFVISAQATGVAVCDLRFSFSVSTGMFGYRFSWCQYILFIIFPSNPVLFLVPSRICHAEFGCYGNLARILGVEAF